MYKRQVVMPSSRGPCRLGEFCELLRVLLRNRGCDYEWIVLDVPSDIGMKELLKRASQILPEVWRDKKHRKSLLKKPVSYTHLEERRQCRYRNGQRGEQQQSEFYRRDEDLSTAQQGAEK